MPPRHGLRAVVSLPTLPSIGSKATRSLSSSASLSTVLHPRQWTSEQRRLLHQQREREWLRRKAKHDYVDFSHSERAELRRYFDALAEGKQRVGLDKLEDMMVSLGLADTREDVAKLVRAVNGDEADGLDFEEYLTLVQQRVDCDEIFQVFKAMAEGRFGDSGLNVHNAISSYRRRQIMHATGARAASIQEEQRGSKILQNFAALQRSRFAAASLPSTSSSPRPSEVLPRAVLPFDESSVGPAGGLKMLWNGVCHEHGFLQKPRLTSTQETLATTKTRCRSVERPMSPDAVLREVLPQGRLPPKRKATRCGTIIVNAPEVASASATALGSPWRSGRGSMGGSRLDDVSPVAESPFITQSPAACQRYSVRF